MKIKKRILITGVKGTLGNKLTEFYLSQGNSVILGCDLNDSYYNNDIDYIKADIANRDEIKKIIFDFCPDYIINTSAFTNVDLCESERETAWKVNVKGVEHIADAARVIDAHVIHFSTDYIFDGSKGPYSEKAKPNPISYYGRTKLASENALNISGAINTIIRTNVLYGFSFNSRPDFVRWVIDSLSKEKQIRIVTDQVNNPTFIDDIVQGINKIVEYKKIGVFNIGGKEFLTRFDFTLLIADYFHLNKSLIEKITTDELNQPAKRPLKSGLIILKAETELGYKPHTIMESLVKMKKDLQL